ncbi:hypothetical protein ACV6DN_18570 [Enterobacter asburiae]
MATGFIIARAAILAVILTHRYTNWCEKQAQYKNGNGAAFYRDRTDFLSGQFAEGCARVTSDNGEKVYVDGEQSEQTPVAGYPAPPNYGKVAGDLRSLSARLMDKIRELPLRQARAKRAFPSTEQFG